MRFSSASAGCSSALLITIQADWAKRETRRDTPVPPPRGKTRVEWHGGAPAVWVRTWRELFAAQKTSRRIAGAGKGQCGVRGRKNMKRNNWNWARCQRAHTISAKSLLTPRGTSRLSASHPRSPGISPRGTYERIVMGYFRSSVVVTRGLLARSNFVTEISSTFLRAEIYRGTFPRRRTHRRFAEKGFIDGYTKLKIDSVLRGNRLLTNYKTIPLSCWCARLYWIKVYCCYSDHTFLMHRLM